MRKYSIFMPTKKKKKRKIYIHEMSNDFTYMIKGMCVGSMRTAYLQYIARDMSSIFILKDLYLLICKPITYQPPIIVIIIIIVFFLVIVLLF